MFLDWAKRTRLYFADLLVPDAAADVARLLTDGTVPIEERLALLQLLGSMHATVNPLTYAPCAVAVPVNARQCCKHAIEIRYAPGLT